MFKSDYPLVGVWGNSHSHIIDTYTNQCKTFDESFGNTFNLKSS